ncbi:MAG: hypothetical protein AB7P22_10370 [Vicinamibacterales bacterium]
MKTIDSASGWTRLLAGLFLVFGLFHWLALWLGSDAAMFPLIWMAASAVLPLFVLLIPSRSSQPGAGTPRSVTMR